MTICVIEVIEEMHRLLINVAQQSGKEAGVFATFPHLISHPIILIHLKLCDFKKNEMQTNWHSEYSIDII